MTVQDFFESIDKTLGLGYMPLIYIALISVVCFTVPLIFLFKPFSFSASSKTSEGQQKNQKITHWFTEYWPIGALIICVTLLVYRSIQVMLLVNYRVASTEYILSTVLTVTCLVLLLSSKLVKIKGRFLILLVVAFVLTGDPLINNILNGAEVTETTLDTVNILFSGNWQFSFHNPVYDALPYDSVLKVFIMNVFGITNPTSVLPKLLIDCCVALIMVFSVLLFVRYLGYSLQVGLLASVFVYSLPYLQFAISPTNLSFVFVTLFIFMLAKCLKTGFKPFSVFFLYLFITCAILAHEMALLALLIPVGVVLFAYIFHRNKDGSSTLPYPVNNKRLVNVALFSLLVFIITILYTRALTSTYNFAAVYLRNLLGGIAAGPGLTSSNFESMPVSIKVTYILPLAIVGAFLISTFIRNRQQKSVLFNPKPNHLVFFGLYLGIVITGLIGGLSLLGTYTMSKHFGIFMFLYAGLGMVPVLVFLTKQKTVFTSSKITTSLLVLVILVTILFGCLTPHKMPDQYLNTVTLRGGNLEDIEFSDFLAQHASERKSNVTVVQNLNTTRYTVSIALYVASFKQILLTSNISQIGMYPTSNTTYFIHPASDLDQQTKLNFDSMNLVYSSTYYDVLVDS